jgi:hypothetical protein
MLYPGKIDPLSNATEENKRPMLFEQVRRRLRLKHHSLQTEKAYVYWACRAISIIPIRCMRKNNGVLIFKPLAKSPAPILAAGRYAYPV